MCPPLLPHPGMAKFCTISEEDSFGGTVATIPGSIEAEQFDLGIGMGYHDTTPGNSGEVQL